MIKITYCIICGEEICKTTLFTNYNNNEICSSCDSEMFEDSIGYEEG